MVGPPGQNSSGRESGSQPSGVAYRFPATGVSSLGRVVSRVLQTYEETDDRKGAGGNLYLVSLKRADFPR